MWADGLGDVPFAVLRDDLYTFDELTSVDPSDSGRTDTTLDARMGAWFTASSPSALHDAVIRSLHDATIEVALARFVYGRRIVGVMGGHAVERGAPAYRSAAILGRTLARAGLVVATGGGPGVMEAANLGAWSAPFATPCSTTRWKAAPGPVLRAIPRVRRACALDIRRRWPQGGESLGVPTWVYLTNRPPDSRRTSRSTSRTACVRTASSRSHARASCTRRAVREPTGDLHRQRAEQPAARTRCAARWCSSGRHTSARSIPSCSPRSASGRRVRMGELVHLSDDPSEVVAFIEATIRTGAVAGSSAGERTTRLSMVSPIVHAPTELVAVPRRVRVHPIRARSSGGLPGGVHAETDAIGHEAARVTAAGRSDRLDAVISRSSRSIPQAASTSIRRSMPSASRRATASSTRSPVAAFVAPGGALDAVVPSRCDALSARRRTPMLPSCRRGAASLLPDQERAALGVDRRSRTRIRGTTTRHSSGTRRCAAAPGLDYAGVQAALDGWPRRRAHPVATRDRRAPPRDSKAHTAGSASIFPSQEVTPAPGGGLRAWIPRRRCPSRGSTRRSRSLPALKPPRS